MRYGRLPLLLLLVPLVSTCNGALAQALCNATYAVCVAKAGPFCGENTCGKSGSGDDNGPDPATEGPWYGPDALDLDPDACGTVAQGYGACVACITPSPCCRLVLDCTADETCTCLMAKSTPGVSWPGGDCGEPDETWTSLARCMSDNCAAECSTGAP